MHHRFLSWLFLGAFVALVSLRAQAPAAAVVPASLTQDGLILVAKVVGTVNMTHGGQVSQLKVDDKVPVTAKINVLQNASIILAFSNGATTHLGSDTELIIEEYLQDPFAATIKVAEMTDEPSPSRTRLALNKGELVGNVKKLQYAKGSGFTVQTPVGAAGIRGTTFRIVFRPSGTGQAFFTLSTASGDVSFAQPAAPGGGTATATQGAPAPTPGTPADPNAPTPGGATPGPSVSGVGTATGISVPQGQEITITVNVTQNATGQMIVTVLPPPTTTTSSISPINLQAVTTVAADIAVAVQQAVFTSPSPAPAGTSAPGGTPAAPSGSTTGSTSGTTTGSTSGNPPSPTVPTTPGTPATPAAVTQTVTGQNFNAQVTATPPPAATAPRIVPSNPGP